MSPLEVFFASIAAITSTLAIAQPIWLVRHRHSLRWAILEPKAMMDIAEEIANDVTLHYRGRVIADLTKYQFILHNTGQTPIEKSDIVGPLRWVGPGAILAARVAATEPPVDLSLEVRENQLEFSWLLFNQRCRALIEVLCEGGSSDYPGRISGQIRNIPSIEVKRISVVDEDELLKRMELVSQMTTPKFLRRLNRLFVNRWFLRFRWIPIAASLLPATLSLWLVGEQGGVSAFVLAIGAVVVAVFTLGVSLFLRNQYGSLLSKARKSR